MKKTFDLHETYLYAADGDNVTPILDENGQETGTFRLKDRSKILGYAIAPDEPQPFLSDKYSVGIKGYKLTLDTLGYEELNFNEDTAREFIDTLNEYFGFNK